MTTMSQKSSSWRMVHAAASASILAFGAWAMSPVALAGPAGYLGHSVYGAYAAAGQAEIEHDFSTAAALLGAILDSGETDPALERRALLAFLHAGLIDRAVDVARPQAETFPREVNDAALTIAVDALKRGQWDQVIKILEPPRQVALARFATPILSAWAYFGKGEIDAAIDALDPLRKTGQADLLYDVHASLIYLAAGKPGPADKILTPLNADLENAPLNTVRAQARAKQALGESGAAEDLLGGYNAFHPNAHLIQRDLDALRAGETLKPLVATATEGSAEAMIDLARQVRDQAPLIALRYARLGNYLDDTNNLGHLVVGVILQSLKRPQEAMDALHLVGTESVYSWDARMEIADSLITLDQDADAMARLEAMAEERPSDISALNKLGLLMRIRERFAEGSAYYDRAIARLPEIKPENWYLFYYRGITLERTQRWPEAEADFKRALELRPKDPYVLNYLGYSWIDQGINVPEALDMIRDAVTELPKDGNIVDSLGWAYFKLKNYDEAVVHLERAIQLQPGEPVINDHLGDAYWRVGREFEARYQWQHAIALGADETIKAAAEKKIEVGLDAYEASQAE